MHSISKMHILASLTASSHLGLLPGSSQIAPSSSSHIMASNIRPANDVVWLAVKENCSGAFQCFGRQSEQGLGVHQDGAALAKGCVKQASIAVSKMQTQHQQAVSRDKIKTYRSPILQKMCALAKESACAVRPENIVLRDKALRREKNFDCRRPIGFRCCLCEAFRRLHFHAIAILLRRDLLRPYRERRVYTHRKSRSDKVKIFEPARIVRATRGPLRFENQASRNYSRRHFPDQLAKPT